MTDLFINSTNSLALTTVYISPLIGYTNCDVGQVGNLAISSKPDDFAGAESFSDDNVMMT